MSTTPEGIVAQSKQKKVRASVRKSARTKSAKVTGLLGIIVTVQALGGPSLKDLVDYVWEQGTALEARGYNAKGIARGVELDLNSAAQALVHYREGQPLRVNFWNPAEKADLHTLAARMKSNEWPRVADAIMAADEMKDARTKNGCLSKHARGQLEEATHRIIDGANALERVADQGRSTEAGMVRRVVAHAGPCDEGRVKS